MTKKFNLINVTLILTWLVLPNRLLSTAPKAVISGELKQWHPITLTFNGPKTGERAVPNPFREYRLTVDFAYDGQTQTVPGYFAADGKAAETSAEEGDQWRIHFVPDQIGKWSYKVSFRKGQDVAVSNDPNAGKPDSLDGLTGDFIIGATDKSGRDPRARGMLRYVGERYLQFAGNGEYFIKGGADSPENFLAYFEFDGTDRAFGDHQGLVRRGEASISPLHKYRTHQKDWKAGDPTWQGGKGKGIIGALNYLASKGMNSVYFLTMNVEGDGRDVWPWINMDARDRFDCSKLEQWDIVFSHLDKLGILLHVITQEQENDQLLNGGELSLERKLYYRELIARFSHHLALIWNLGEENTNSDLQRKAYCKFIRELDPYDHPIVVHTFPNKKAKVYTPLLGFSDFEGPSLQMGDMKKTHSETIKWLDRSVEIGHKWFVCLDEIGPAREGVKPDQDDPDHKDVRHYALWGNLMAGGAGCEWYFGYKFPNNDLNCENWRSREKIWDYTRYAIEFFHRYLPFWEMKHHDEFTSAEDDYCFAKPGEIYVIYLPHGSSTKIKLVKGKFTVHWYDPRNGGNLQKSSVTKVKGPGWISIGQPPKDHSNDWVVLIKR